MPLPYPGRHRTYGRVVTPERTRHPGHLDRGEPGLIGSLTHEREGVVGRDAHTGRDQAHRDVDQALLAEAFGGRCAPQGVEAQVGVGHGSGLPRPQRGHEPLDAVVERVGGGGVEIDVEHGAAVLDHGEAHRAGDPVERPFARHVGPAALVQRVRVAPVVRRSCRGTDALARARASRVRDVVHQREREVVVQQRDAEGDTLGHGSHRPALDHAQQPLHVVHGQRDVLVERLPALGQQLHGVPLRFRIACNVSIVLLRPAGHHTRPGVPTRDMEPRRSGYGWM